MSACGSWPRARTILCGLVLAAGWGWAVARAQAPACRVAFDMGSSGVRAAATGPGTTAAMPRRDLDLLQPLWQGQSLEEPLPQVIALLQELPRQARWPADCARLGAGFSAWRLAWQLDGQLDGPRLVGQLRRLHAQAQVPVLVMPAQIEGRYAYETAQRVLGPRLSTSHVLDIGGGSLQLAGAASSFSAELGQKAWHRRLCLALRSTPSCVLQALDAAELQRARTLLDELLADLPAQLGAGVRLTALSRPVTRGVAPALARLRGAVPSQAVSSLSLGDLRWAIGQLAPLPLQEVAARVGAAPTFAAYLLSDLLLTEGLLRATGGPALQLAELDLNILPALLADERAFAWGSRYPCYLERLASEGPAAYFSDPSTCRAP